MIHPAASEIGISPNVILSASALAGLVELAGPDLKGANATVPQKEEEGQRATASTQSGKRRRNRVGSDRRRATGQAHGGDDARGGAARKGDR